MTPISRTTPISRFEGHDIFLKTETKLKLHNRKLYLTYEMVLCLLILTDLQTRRAGVSMIAEFLVFPMHSLDGFYQN